MDFTVDNMRSTELNKYVYDFPVDCNSIDVSDTVDIHKYVMKNQI